MPIYEYQCSSCGHYHEALQKISDDPLKDCPNCGKPDLSKLVSASAFRLGGTGWYETDFKSGGKKNLAGDSNKPDSGSGDSNKESSKDTSKKDDKKSAPAAEAKAS